MSDNQGSLSWAELFAAASENDTAASYETKASGKPHFLTGMTVRDIPVSEETLRRTAGQEMAKPTQFPELQLPVNWVSKEEMERRYKSNVYDEVGPGVYVAQRSSSIFANPDEVRIKDEKTGGEKGAKLQRFSLIPPEFVWALAEHYGKGAQKYADRNWERGYKWSLSIDALERHLQQFKMGEWLDTETGTPHIIAVAWHACALFIFKLRGLGTNDLFTHDWK